MIFHNLTAEVFLDEDAETPGTSAGVRHRSVYSFSEGEDHTDDQETSTPVAKKRPRAKRGTVDFTGAYGGVDDDEDEALSPNAKQACIDPMAMDKQIAASYAGNELFLKFQHCKIYISSCKLGKLTMKRR